MGYVILLFALVSAILYGVVNDDRYLIFAGSVAACMVLIVIIVAIAREKR